MAASSYQAFLTRLINVYEGTKYTDGKTPYDPGGPTRYGITLADARLHWKSNATADDVKNMPMSVAIGIYKSKYWDALWGDKLSAGTDGVVVDYGVNSGISRSGKVLRRVLGLPDNKWQVDDTVMAALTKRDRVAVINAISDERLAFLKTLKIYPTYKGGWVKRVNSERNIAIALATAKPVSQADVAVLNEPTAKAVIPAPTTTKNVVKGSAPTVAVEEAVRDGGNWYDWILAHQVDTGIIVLGVCAAVFIVVHLLNKNHQAKQDAPTPGLVPVPELPELATQGA